MASGKKLIFGSLTIIFGFSVAFLFLEILLRILPTSTPNYANPVNSQNPIANFRPNNFVRSSKGWNFDYISHKRTNNYGFFNDSDYRKQSKLPLLGAIGDSFVEAIQVDNDETFHGLLSGNIGETGRIYSFGFSGSPLSQYLAYADFARKEFLPESFVFIIIRNDFHESLKKYKAAPGHYYFVDYGDELVLERIDRKELSLPIRVVREFAIGGFLFKNLRIHEIETKELLKSISRLWDFSPEKKQKEYLGNVPREVGEEKENDSYRAIDKFFELLPGKTGVQPSNVLFVMNGINEGIYFDIDIKASYVYKMRNHFMAKARRIGYEVIDMHPVFKAEYIKNSEKYEYANDSHWNELGHFMVAQEIAKSNTFNTTFGRKVDLGNKPKGGLY